MDSSQTLTDTAVLSKLGKRLAQYRLERDLTQATLAREAGISERTLLRLEGGESTQLTSLIRVLRVLGLAGNLDRLVPEPAESPIERLRAKEQRRKRASGRSGTEPGTGTEWTWGDDA